MIRDGIWDLTQVEPWQEKELVLIEDDTNYAQPFAELSGGFTFGKTVAYFPGNRFFALDLRFRYLRV